MTIEEQVWNGLCSRIRYATVADIAKKLKLNKSTVKSYVLMYYKRGLLDMKLRPSDKVKRYKIKD
jgi:predicted DNA-binding transcriptional regulator